MGQIHSTKRNNYDEIVGTSPNSHLVPCGKQSILVLNEQLANLVKSLLSVDGSDVTTVEGTFVGRRVNHIPSGHGKAIVPAGEYEGEWLNGKPHGIGTMKTYTKTIIGTFDKGWPRGIVTVHFISTKLLPPNDGSGLLNVEEIKVLARDRIYNGKYSTGEMTGRGTLECPGERYEGSFRNNFMHGWGTYTNATEKYEGYWERGKRHGRGTHEITSEGYKSTYVGKWRDDKRHGKGTFTEKQGFFLGGVYVGQWREDKEHGHGKFTGIGIVAEGKWENGEFKGRYRYPNSSSGSDGSNYDRY